MGTYMDDWLAHEMKEEVGFHSLSSLLLQAGVSHRFITT
jgi:hypothetical protein